MPLTDLGANTPGLVNQYMGRRQVAEGIEARLNPVDLRNAMSNLDPAGRAMLTQEQAGLVNANDNVADSLNTLSGLITPANVPQMRTEYFNTLTDDGQRVVYQDFLTRVEVPDTANEQLRNAAGAFQMARLLRTTAESNDVARIYGTLRAMGVEEPGVLLAGQFSRYGDAVGMTAVANRIANAQVTIGRNILRDSADARTGADALMTANNQNAVNAVASMYSIYENNQNLRRPVNP